METGILRQLLINRIDATSFLKRFGIGISRKEIEDIISVIDQFYRDVT